MTGVGLFIQKFGQKSESDFVVFAKKNPDLLVIQDKEGNTFAHYMALMGCEEALIECYKMNKECFKIQNEHGNTCLNWAAEYGLEKVLAMVADKPECLIKNHDGKDWADIYNENHKHKVQKVENREKEITVLVH